MAGHRGGPDLPVRTLYAQREIIPGFEYNLALGALAALAVMPVITFIHLSGAATGVAPQLTAHGITLAGATGASSQAGVPLTAAGLLGHWLSRLIPWAVPAWLLGVSIASIRVFRSWRHAYRIRTSATFIYMEEWQSKIETLCRQFGIHKWCGWRFPPASPCPR